MLTYRSCRKKHTDNTCPKELIMMTNKEIKGKSRCADCMANKSFSDKIKHKSELEIIASQFFNRFNLIKRNMLTYYVECRKNTENVNSKISKTQKKQIDYADKMCCVWN